MGSNNTDVTWKWLVGVLFAVIGGFASVTYASMDHRVTVLEQKDVSAELSALKQEVKDMREVQEDLTQQLHELLGTDVPKHSH